jgi:NDP-sugar pyrophosphorylase family protein
VCNRPFLAWQLALLRQHGVTDVILSCSYRVDDVRRALAEERHGVSLRYVIEKEPLGTGGGVRNAADIARGHVFVLNGDVLTDVDLGAMRRLHEAQRARVTIFLTRVQDPRQYGLVETDAGGRIRRFREKPGPDEAVTSDTINAGVYLIDAELLRRMPTDRPVSIEREFFPALIEDGVPCVGFLAAAYWRDIGNPAAYHAAQMDVLEGRLRTPLAPPGEARDRTWIASSVRVAAGARVESPCALAAGVRVDAGARVGPRAVLGAGCIVAAGAHVESAVLWERVEVGRGAVLRDCVVGADAQIGAYAVLGAGVVVESGAVVPAHARLPDPPPGPAGSARVID